MNIKKMERIKKAINLLVGILLVAIIFPIEVFAIGQTTDPIAIKNALRGNEYQKTMIIVNTEATDSMITFAAHGDIEKWAKFYKFNDFSGELSEVSMKTGETRNISVVFNVPQDAPNGNYKGYVSAVKKPDASGETDGSSTSVSQEINREVSIEVNDNEIVSFEVSVIPKTYDLSKGEMLDIRLIYDNMGNTSISPQAQIRIKKDDQTVYNSIYPYPESESSVKPGAVYEIPAIQIPTSNFEKGRYRAEMSFLVDGKIILEKKFGFSVDMLDSVEQSGVVLGANDDNLIKGIGIANLFLYMILVILAVVAILMIFRNKRNIKDQIIAKNDTGKAESE